MVAALGPEEFEGFSSKLEANFFDLLEVDISFFLGGVENVRQEGDDTEICIIGDLLLPPQDSSYWDWDVNLTCYQCLRSLVFSRAHSVMAAAFLAPS